MTDHSALDSLPDHSDLDGLPDLVRREIIYLREIRGLMDWEFRDENRKALIKDGFPDPATWKMPDRYKVALK